MNSFMKEYWGLMIEFEELLLALNELENIVVITDLDGNVRYVNDAFKAKYGYTREEILGKSTRMLNANYHKPSFYEKMWTTLKSGEIWEGIFLNKSKSGQLIWERAKISTIKKDGEISGYIAIKEDITYKKQLEEQFEQEKYLLDELFENTPFGIITFEPLNDKKYFEELLVVKSNPKANKLFNRTSLVGLDLNNFLADFKLLKNDETNMFLYRSTHETFFPSINKHLKLITFPLDKDGFCMFIHDITDYKNSIKAKQESELRYAKLVEDTPALIRRFNKKGVLSYVNSSYAEHLNSKVDQLLGTNFFNLYRGNDKDLFKKRISQLSVDNPITEYEQYIIQNSGEEQWIKWVDRALFDSENKIVEYQSVGMDFTDFKKAEHQLADQKKRLDTLFDNSLMGICVINTECTIISSNKRLADMLGFNSIGEFIGSNYFDFIADDSLFKSVRENFEIVFSSFDQSFYAQREYRTIDGTLFWGDIFMTPITTKNGKVVEAVGMVVDITKRKLAEQELKANEEKLRQLNATKDKLFSVIAHDIRNPFNVILGFANLLELNIEQLEHAEIKEYVHKITDASEQTFKLLEDLLTWAKSQLGQLKVYKEEFKPSEVILDIVNGLQALSSSKSIRIEIECPASISLISDQTMFKFVVRNLLHNAIKFSHQGGLVLCKVRYKDEKYLSVDIIDYGVGIKAEKLSTLFDINDLVSSKGTDEEAGTGLGLSIAKEMVELNGGEITVSSETNVGSEFVIILPVT